MDFAPCSLYYIIVSTDDRRLSVTITIQLYAQHNDDWVWGCLCQPRFVTE